MTDARRRRGRDSELRLAEWLVANGFPHAEAVPPLSGGQDIRGVPGWAVEVKSRNNLSLPAWLRQAAKYARGGAVPLLVVRGPGQGTDAIGQWAAVMTLDHWVGAHREEQE
jgi:hypothetical protein